MKKTWSWITLFLIGSSLALAEKRPSYPSGAKTYRSQNTGSVVGSDRLVVDWDRGTYSFVDCGVVGGACAPRTEFDLARFPGKVYRATLEEKAAVVLKSIWPDGLERGVGFYLIEKDGVLAKVIAGSDSPFSGGSLYPEPLFPGVPPLSKDVTAGYWRYEIGSICGVNCTLHVDLENSRVRVFGADDYDDGYEFGAIEFKVLGSANRGTLAMKYAGNWISGKGIYFLDQNTAMTWTGYKLVRVRSYP